MSVDRVLSRPNCQLEMARANVVNKARIMQSSVIEKSAE